MSKPNRPTITMYGKTYNAVTVAVGATLMLLAVLALAFGWGRTHEPSTLEAEQGDRDAVSSPRNPESNAAASIVPVGAEDVLSAVNVSGYALNDMRPRPYARTTESLLVLNDPEKEYGEDGRLLQSWPEADGYILHPVNMAWELVYAIESYITSGDGAYLDYAAVNAQALLDGAEEVDGALWFPYPFDYEVRGEYSMPAPWYSGMAQGMALSVFTRMYEITGDEKWRQAADGVFASFTDEGSQDMVFLDIDGDGNLWFEEYVHPDYPSSRVINGHMYSMWGLRDYAVAFGNPTARDLFDAGATTMRKTFNQWRKEGDISYYCAGSICTETAWQPDNYHRGVTRQIEDLALMTGDREFLSMADALKGDGRAAAR